MEDLSEIYSRLIAVENLSGIQNDRAISHIGELANTSLDLRKEEGLVRAIRLSEELESKDLTPAQHSIFYYNFANCWSWLGALRRKGTARSFDFEQEELEKQILYYRTAYSSVGFSEQPREQKCKNLTNIGCLFSNIGRFVEAVEYFDKAIELDHYFGMAVGNRGYGLVYYAQAHYNLGHRDLLRKHAYIDLKKAESLPLEGNAKEVFERTALWIESQLGKTYLEKTDDLNDYPLGDSDEEIRYRKWCLENRLFLNPLNDLGPFPRFAHDILSLPNIVVEPGEVPYFHTFFDQIKQEYVTARFLFYDGTHSKNTHFSDKDVLLYNSLDYPAYGINIEKVKIAFRMLYSEFDKIAFMLNFYFRLNIGERQVYFKRLWYKKEKHNTILRKEFSVMENWALRGLFWLSKDLHIEGFQSTLEPNAQEIAEIRNYLEHKYLKVIDTNLPCKEVVEDPFMGYPDRFAFRIYRGELEAKTLKLLKLVRASLIYLSFAIHIEERIREN